jgi:hypothetical protein
VYEVHTNEEIEMLVNIYISYDLSLLSNPLQNAQQHQHTRTYMKKTMLFEISLPIASYAQNKKFRTFSNNNSTYHQRHKSW